MALFTFAIAAQAAFPYRERLAAALAGEYDVRVGEVSNGWLPGRFSVEDVRLTSRGPEPVVLAFDEIDLDVDIGALLGGRIDLELDGEGRSGVVEGRIHESGPDVAVDLEVSRAPLGFLSIGTTTGGAGLSVHLTLPAGNLAAARGELGFSCADCSTVEPRVRLGRVAGRLSMKGGVACIDSLSAASGDGELILEGGVRFGPHLGAIEADLLARFRMTDAFRAASAAHRELDNRIAGPARLDDGRIGYAGKGRLGSLVWTAASGAPARPECMAIGLPAPASPAAPVGVARAPVMQTLGLPRALPFPGTEEDVPPVEPAGETAAPAAPQTLEPEIAINPEIPTTPRITINPPVGVPIPAPEESPPPPVPMEF